MNPPSDKCNAGWREWSDSVGPAHMSQSSCEVNSDAHCKMKP